MPQPPGSLLLSPRPCVSSGKGTHGVSVDTQLLPSQDPLADPIGFHPKSDGTTAVGHVSLLYGILRLVVQDLKENLARDRFGESEIQAFADIATELHQLASTSQEYLRPIMPDTQQTSNSNSSTVFDCGSTQRVTTEDTQQPLKSYPSAPSTAAGVAVKERVIRTEESSLEEFRIEGQDFTVFRRTNSPHSQSSPRSQSQQDFNVNTVHEDPRLLSWQRNLLSIFHQIDVDKSGSISADELRGAFTQAGIPQARLQKFLSLADQDHNGEIEYKEWVATVISHSDDDKEELQRLSLMLESLRLHSRTIYSNSSLGWCQATMISPYQRGRLLWDMIISILCVYVAIGLPFSLAFRDNFSDPVVNVMDWIDRFVDYFMLLDVAINFRTGYFNADGELVMDPRKVAAHYLRTWFLVDIISSIPYEDISSNNMIDLQSAKLLKLGKLSKVLKLLKPRNLDFADMSETLDDIFHSKSMQQFSRRGPLLVTMVLLCHWMACGFKLVSDNSRGFLSGHELYREVTSSVSREYLASLYWSMTTLTTVGYGDIIPQTDMERQYCILAMIVGGAFYGYFVGTITSIVANSDLSASAYYDRMDLIHAWLAHHRLPLHLKRTVHRYFKAYLSDRSALDEAMIWNDLSPELQKDLGEFIVHEHVRFNPIFDGVTLGSIVRVQSVLRRVTVLAGRVITQSGEAGTAMYIIVSGVVDMRGAFAESISFYTKSMGPGQSFGEEVLMGLKDYYEYTTTARQKAKLEMILEDEFLALFERMPNVLDRMRRNIWTSKPPELRSKLRIKSEG